MKRTRRKGVGEGKREGEGERERDETRGGEYVARGRGQG